MIDAKINIVIKIMMTKNCPFLTAHTRLVLKQLYSNFQFIKHLMLKNQYENQYETHS